MSKELVRRLGLFSAVMLLIGTVIGSGIFKKPAVMAGYLQSPELLIAVWVVAGLVTFFGALTNAEVSGLFEKTGGQYLYFRTMYGDFFAYLFGWSMLAVIQCGSQAAIAYIFAEYLGYFVAYPQHWSQDDYALWLPLVGDIYPLKELPTKLVAVGAILLLTAINYVGVYAGGVVQNVLTSIKIGAMLLLVLFLFLLGKQGNVDNFWTDAPNFAHFSFLQTLSAFGLAMSGAFWAYDGWNNITFVTGEMHNPQKNIPRAFFLGTLSVIAIYVLINLAYLYVLPIDKMAQSKLVAATAAEIVMGEVGASFIAVAVIISTFGSLNGSLLASARIPFAMAKDKLFFTHFGQVHPRFHTPHFALLVQGIWAAILVFSGTFDIITDYVIFAAWLYYASAGLGIFILRWRMPEAHRPYKVWAYPLPPLIFVAFSFFFLINTCIAAPEKAAMGILLIALGIPFYAYLKRKKD
ncbi:MAG: amino acid permease [Cytophagales bacterium]|nr:MAG: amino acid permease [Cytophagales bacterium]